MSTRNAVVRIVECLVLWCALSMLVAEGRSLHSIHRRHGGGRAKNLMDLENERYIDAELDYPMDFEPTSVRHSRRRHSRNRESVVASGLEDDLRNLGMSDDEQPDFRKLLTSTRGGFHAINKRHNEPLDDAAYASMSEIDEKAFLKSRARGLHRRNKRYEVEIREAQNSSLCNYTIVDIPDPSPDNSRVPKNLVNVMCNHAGSRCRDTGNYCCIQTYTKIDVTYGNGENENLKVYTGCVCSLRFYGELKPYKPRLAIDD